MHLYALPLSTSRYPLFLENKQSVWKHTRMYASEKLPSAAMLFKNLFLIVTSSTFASRKHTRTHAHTDAFFERSIVSTFEWINERFKAETWIYHENQNCIKLVVISTLYGASKVHLRTHSLTCKSLVLFLSWQKLNRLFFSSFFHFAIIGLIGGVGFGFFIVFTVGFSSQKAHTTFSIIQCTQLSFFLFQSF